MESIILGEICDVLNGYAFKSEKYTTQGYRVIRITNVQKGVIVDDDPKYYSPEDMELLKKYELFENDILVSLTGNVGRVGIVGNSLLPAALNQRVACLRIKNKAVVDYKYLYYYLNTDQIENLCIVNSNGIAQKNLSTLFLNTISILMPSLEKQKKIVQVLDKAQSLINKRKAQIEKLDKFIQSVFLEMFGDPVENEREWVRVKLHEVAKVKIGPFGSLLHKEDYVKNGVPLVNPSHIINGKISIDDWMTVSNEKVKELEAYRMKSGNVVIGRRGEIGRCALVGHLEDGYLCGTGSMFVSLREELSPVYLVYLLSSPTIRAVLEHQAKGITMKNLNAGALESLGINLPPLDLQNKFAAIVEKTEQQKALMQQSLLQLEDNFNSLMQRAFKGELFN